MAAGDQDVGVVGGRRGGRGRWGRAPVAGRWVTPRRRWPAPRMNRVAATCAARILRNERRRVGGSAWRVSACPCSPFRVRNGGPALVSPVPECDTYNLARSCPVRTRRSPGLRAHGALMCLRCARSNRPPRPAPLRVRTGGGRLEWRAAPALRPGGGTGPDRSSGRVQVGWGVPGSGSSPDLPLIWSIQRPRGSAAVTVCPDGDGDGAATDRARPVRVTTRTDTTTAATTTSTPPSRHRRIRVRRLHH